MEPTGSLAQLLAWRVAERPGHPCVWVEDEGPWSVGQLAASAAATAGALDAVGVEPRCRVIVRIGNDERFLAALVAIWLRRGVAVAVHPAAPVSEVARVVTTLRARAVIADPADVVHQAADVQVDAPIVDLPSIPRDAPALTELAVPADVSDEDPALILLTSGSTGAPKGIVLTHGSGWSNLRATVSAFRRDTNPGPLPTDRRPPNLVANPFSHTGGVVRLLFALYVGRGLVVLRKFDAHTAKAAIDAHGIDNLTINPAMLRMLLDAVPPIADLGAVRYVSSGTAPLPSTLREEFEARFDVPVLQSYGQTEAFGGIAIESARDVLDGRRRPSSVGRPLPGVEVRITDANGRSCAPGADGEILARTKSSTAGYADDTADAGSPVDAEGWLHTGDLGHLDEDGYLYVTGRLKSIIICGGFNVIPEELETCLEDDPDVRGAAVVSVADDRLGELPVAVVEGSGDPSAILERVGERLVAYKRPRDLFVVDALPRLASGKVDKPAVARLVGELRLR